jgi:phosphatidylglycerophosphate synthase
MTTQHSFTDARREHKSLLASREKQVLVWLAARMPAWINSDHLTVLGLAGMALSGAAYALSGSDPTWLHIANLGLLVNWFGDSLDGTLARHRQQLRPRYGYYVDHVVDSFGAVFILGGLALSGYMTTTVALAFLAAYFMLSINVYLAAHSLGTFQLSFWKLGPTELRILLAIGTLTLFGRPTVDLFGSRYQLFDVGATVGAISLMVILLVSSLRNTMALYRAETPRASAQSSPSTRTRPSDASF